MSKGLHGLNPGNQAFKQFKCPILNVLSRIVFVEKKHSHQEIKGQHCHKI